MNDNRRDLFSVDDFKGIKMLQTLQSLLARHKTKWNFDAEDVKCGARASKQAS